MGLGRGFGMGSTGYPAARQVPEGDELGDLQAYAKELRGELERVEKRISSLKER